MRHMGRRRILWQCGRPGQQSAAEIFRVEREFSTVPGAIEGSAISGRRGLKIQGTSALSNTNAAFGYTLTDGRNLSQFPEIGIDIYQAPEY